ncbi:MAG: DNA-directed DNA polymerase II small subunit [Thermoplasmata archaeon]|nr:DNA-directed DNA polymerase II small subunit [Thermoplasmata archaeon]
MSRSTARVLAEKGILVDPGAAEALSLLSDADACVERILADPNRPLVLTKADIDTYAACVQTAPAAAPRAAAARGPDPAPQGREGIRVLKDITGDSTCVGNVIDFAKLFNDRYASLRRMLAKRRELAGMLPISKVRRLERDLRFAGILNDIYTTKNGHTMLELEDENDKIQVLVMKGTMKANEAFLRDEVLGIVGVRSKDGELVIAKDIIRPEVAINNAMTPNDSESIVAFVSDIHVGSTTFLPDHWVRFTKWLRKDAVAKDIKYMVVPGDLVDGIGIYPGQEEELLIEDVYEQYKTLSEMAKQIPDWIKVVMMPGNHDAVRLAEPQPALPKDIQSLFDSNIMFVGNPCLLDVEGRTVLAYHGRSFDDFIAGARHLSYAAPIDTMKEMLRRRHLAPVYGERTALAPEQKDHMVIDTVPNIFVTGHVHKCATADYRGIKLINASAWQSQTSFQRMHNQVPDPAKVPMVHLGTGETWVEDFMY